MPDENPEPAGTPNLEEMVEFLDQLGQRHPVVRTGARQPILWPVRLAVLIRDGNTCCRCGSYVRVTGAELDHITPWSAGGGDDTTNLRVLCRACNQDRSNRRDGDEAPRQPATWWCSACSDGTHPFYSDIAVLDSWRSSCTDEEWQAAYWVARRLQDPVLAFCARCDGSGYALWVL